MSIVPGAAKFQCNFRLQNVDGGFAGIVLTTDFCNAVISRAVSGRFSDTIYMTVARSQADFQTRSFSYAENIRWMNGYITIVQGGVTFVYMPTAMYSNGTATDAIFVFTAQKPNIA